MPYISEETILGVQRAVDIYEVVSSYLPLKRSGVNYKGLCPFHEEKTPSFMVHPERQIYKCFGCGQGGSVFKFVQEMEKVDFPEAVRLLAERAGIPIRYEGGKGGPERKDVYGVLEWAAKHYRRILKANPEAEPARKYAAGRGLTEETMERWGVGYARDAWDDVMSSARRNGFSESALVAAGLVTERQSGTGYYDRFRGRLIFPIRDPRGRIVGFGGRILGAGEPKYLNSPETAVFSKGSLLYGLDLAREAAAENGTLFITEGYFDVVLPEQSGVKGMVATLGTALTKDHLAILRRYVRRVVLVFDADAAGQRAAERGLDLLLGEDLDLFVASMPAGKDPADVVTGEGGPEALRSRLENPVEIFEFLVDSLEARLGGDTPSARQRVVEQMTERVAQIPNEIKREVLLQRLSRRYGVSEGALRARMRSLRKTEPAAAPAPRKPGASDPAERVGRELIGIMLLRPAWIERIRQDVPAERFPTEGTREVAQKLYALYQKEGDVRAGDLAALIEDRRSAGVVADVLDSESAPDEELEKRLAGCLEFLDSAEFRQRAQELRSGLRAAQGSEADERARMLQRSRGMRNARAIPRE